MLLLSLIEIGLFYVYYQFLFSKCCWYHWNFSKHLVSKTGKATIFNFCEKEYLVEHLLAKQSNDWVELNDLAKIRQFKVVKKPQWPATSPASLVLPATIASIKRKCRGNGVVTPLNAIYYPKILPLHKIFLTICCIVLTVHRWDDFGWDQWVLNLNPQKLYQNKELWWVLHNWLKISSIL